MERIVPKVGFWWGALHWLVVLVTFGTNRRFRSSYATTLGYVIGVPVGWDLSLPRYQFLLAHERVHIRQQEFLGFGNAWVGLPLWGLIWLLFPLPLGLAWGRYMLERSAYVEGYRAELAAMRAAGESADRVLSQRAYLITSGVEQLTTGAYGWAWVFPAAVRRYFERNVT